MNFISKIRNKIFIKSLKKCFAKGKIDDRRKVLKAIAEAVHEEYVKEDYFILASWLLDEFLISDPYFNNSISPPNLNNFNQKILKSFNNTYKIKG